MDKRRIGSLEVSAVGLGCNNFGGRLDAESTARVVDAALDDGITFFDTADRYGDTRSEEYLGRALGTRRASIVLATKFGSKIDESRQGARPAYVRRAVEDSLRRLGTDWIDLYQLHRPDPSVPIGETLGALNELVREGKVREIGCSNFSVDQLREAARERRSDAARFVTVQNEYSVLHREPEEGVLAECVTQGLALLPYFPLASGLLSGKYVHGVAPPGSRLGEPDRGLTSRFLSDANIAAVERLTKFANERGHTVLELALSWLLARSGVASVIPGATSADQVRANVAGASWRLADDDLRAIDRLTRPSA
jgi:aryl-alcohol dehydrogenase-like predicted oxidoreductase